MIQVLLFDCDRLTTNAVSHLLSYTQDIALLAKIDEFSHLAQLPNLQPDVIVMQQLVPVTIK